MARTIHIPTERTLRRPNWRRVLLRVEEQDARPYVVAAEEVPVAGPEHEPADPAARFASMEALRDLALGRTHVVFLGEPVHTTIMRA